MDRKEFFRRLTVETPLYATFNTLRDSLFTALAVDPRHPMSEEVLHNIITRSTEDQIMNDPQVQLINTFVGPGDEYRLYDVSAPCNMDLLYIVNMNKTEIPRNGVIDSDYVIAAHQMAVGIVPEEGGSRVDFSVICLAEKHDLMTPVKYPKIIKHELVHAAMNHIAVDDTEIRKFIKDANAEKSDGGRTHAPENYEFIELICDIVPYLSVPVKKENGIDKFMEDAHTIFGYDENDPLLSEGVAIINEVQQESMDTAE